MHTLAGHSVSSYCTCTKDDNIISHKGDSNVVIITYLYDNNLL